jgi:hypothetical protein
MSEYQYVVFQAVDRPLNDKELAFAERQSSRADVSRWSLSCDYHYSSFRGDVDGLLRRARELLGELLTGDTASVKASLLAEVRDSHPTVNWPTTDKQRTCSELLKTAEALCSRANAQKARNAQAKAKRDAAKAERERQARMKKMVNDPKKWLREAEDLAEARGTDNYQAAAEILFDLGEAIGGDKGTKLARQHAAHLVKKHPTLSHLKSSLRKRGLLD